MKSKIFLPILFSASSVMYTCDEGTKLLLSVRADQNDVTSIKSLNFPKDLDDATLKTALTQAYNVQTLIAQNNIMKQPKPVPCQGLSIIDFSNGTIEVFRIGDWVQAMPSLQKLNLAHNKISSIASINDAEQTSCGPCGKHVLTSSWHSQTLQEIDLSYNELTEFDLHIVRNAKSLVKADFSHNKISTVVIPKELRHRNVCKVFLNNNQLDSSSINLLEKFNVLNTEEYENSYEFHGGIGAITGTVTGIGSTIGVVFGAPLIQQYPGAAVAVGIINCLAQIGAGWYLGYGVKKCTSCDTVNTYQPFILAFDNQKNNDHVALKLEQLQEEQ